MPDPNAKKWPGQGQPPWIAYSLRDIQAARTGQYPSRAYLESARRDLKLFREIFDPIGDPFQRRREILARIGGCLGTPGSG